MTTSRALAASALALLAVTVTTLTLAFTTATPRTVVQSPTPGVVHVDEPRDTSRLDRLAELYRNAFDTLKTQPTQGDSLS